MRFLFCLALVALVLTTSVNAQYLTNDPFSPNGGNVVARAGRNGKANDFFLSKDGDGTIYGSNTNTKHLKLYGNDQNGSGRVTVQTASSLMANYVQIPRGGLQLFSDSGQTFKGMTLGLTLLGRGNTYTLIDDPDADAGADQRHPEFWFISDADQGPSVNERHTLVFQNDGRALESFGLIGHATILTQNAAAGTRKIGQILGIGNSVVLQADTGTLELLNVDGFMHNPSFSRVNSGVGAWTALNGFVRGLDMKGTVGDGWSGAAKVPHWYGLHMEKPTLAGAGAIDEIVAVEVEDLAGSGITSPFSLKSLGLTVPMVHAGPVRIGDSTTPTQKLEVAGSGIIDAAAYSVAANTSHTSIAIPGPFTWGGSTAGLNVLRNIAIGVDTSGTQQTWPVSSTQAIFGGGQAFQFTPLIDGNGITNMGNFNLFSNQVKLRSNTSNSTTSGLVTLSDTPAFALTGGATLITLTSWNTILSQPGSLAGAVIGTRVGLNYTDWTTPGTGRQNTTIAVDVADQTSSSAFTLAAALRSTITAGTSKYFLRDTGGAQSVVSGKVRLGDTTDPTDTLDLLGKTTFTTTGIVNKYNNVATVSGGIPAEFAKTDTTGNTANIGATLLYAVPAATGGMYRVTALIVETTAASVSSTLPNLQIVYTDNETTGTITMDATPILGVAGIGQTGALTANAVGTSVSGVININAKASTNINYQTVNYASSTAGMAYALHIKLEAM